MYLHIPFCERKCEYCDFASINGKRREQEYVVALRAEIAELARRLPPLQFDTVFVGGGTPSFIEPALLAAVLEDVSDHFGIAAGAEVTMEANPSSIDVTRARTWRAAGFTRISVGVQSLDPGGLRFLGRVHDAQRALAAVDEVRSAGFESVNCDLIYAVPGVHRAAWMRTLQRVVELSPEHVSCYELTVEQGTPLHRSVLRGSVHPEGADEALAQHWIAVEALEAAGYRQYEVSNFARAGHECRHNLAYWRNRGYLAAGVGAHGHLTAAAASMLGLSVEPNSCAVRYWHSRSIGDYLRAGAGGALPIQGWESINAETAEIERLMLGLRLAEGIAMDEVSSGPAAARLLRQGLLERQGGRLRCTRRGQEVLDRVVTELCSDVSAGNSGATAETTLRTAGSQAG